MWVLYTFLSSFLIAVYYFGNQFAKVGGNQFLIYRGFVPMLFFLPFIAQMHLVTDWRFYVLSILQGSLVCFTDYRNFCALKKWGAETISSIHPFGIFMVFVIWLIIKPQNLITYSQNPLQLLLIIAALVGIIYSVSSFKKSKQTWQALVFMLPYLIIRGLCDVINKLCIGFVATEHLADGNCLYIMLTSFVIGTVNLFLYYKKGGRTKEIINLKNWPYVLIVIVLIFQMLPRNLAMYSTPNPSFVTALMYMYVIWIMLAGKILKH